MICSSGADSTSTTIVIRLKRSSSVGATASEKMLNPRRLNRLDDAGQHAGLVLDQGRHDVVARRSRGSR